MIVICYNELMNNYPTTVRLFYKIAANFIFLMHLTLVCFVAVGWLIPGFFYAHFILLMITILSEIFLGYCPLTRLEFNIRKKLDPTLVFDKSCIMHYLRKWRSLGPRPAISPQASFFRKNSFIFILLVFGMLSFVFNFVYKNQEKKQGVYQSLRIGGTTLNIKVADDDTERIQGLSGRESLEENEGLLFVFDKQGYYGIWMKDMNFPIDIVWLDQNKKIIHIESAVGPETYPKIFNPPNLSLYVLETPSGFLAKNNIKIGDLVAF